MELEFGMLVLVVVKCMNVYNFLSAMAASGVVVVSERCTGCACCTISSSLNDDEKTTTSDDKSDKCAVVLCF